MSVYKKILAVQEAVGRVPKTGYNSFQKYHYVTEPDLLDAIRQHMVEQQLVLVMTGIEDDHGQYPDGKRWANVSIEYKLVDAEKPEDALTVNSVGYAEDGGDKAVYKAITGASKYLYYKLFLVSTGEDPEREEAQEPKKPYRGQRANEIRYKKSEGRDVTKEASDPKILANQEVKGILDLMEATGMSKEDVLSIGEIDPEVGLKGMAAQGKHDELRLARLKLQEHINTKVS